MEFLTKHPPQEPLEIKEHLFGKVATPSDVGKLNRLVIPKQYAEKYFPLDSCTKKKGIILNFEDPNGKSWRFRYSYWTSSQSYVITKGWSRFVKENKLHAGDFISFERGVRQAATGKCGGRLYIDCRRRHRLNASGGRGAVGRACSCRSSRCDSSLPMVIESMRVVERGGVSEPKYLRLFGVDVELCIPVGESSRR